VSWSVTERGHRIATFRFVEVRLMEMVAAWTPTTPEMEVKVLFGRHIWDFAQHADALGKRTFELRLPLQHSRSAAEPYRALLDEAASLAGTAERLAALYDVVLPDLEARYRAYLEATDQVLDAPSRDIVDRIRTDAARQRAEAGVVRNELGTPPADPTALRERAAALASEGFVAPEVAGG
jgi:hypothetical protein